MTDYFYGGQADLFSFYRLPKALFVDPRFRGISAEAKILYGLLLDRMGLSTKNGWLDDAGRVYIIFTTEEIEPFPQKRTENRRKKLNKMQR